MSKVRQTPGNVTEGSRDFATVRTESEARYAAGHDRVQKAISKFLAKARKDENEPSLDQLNAHWPILEGVIYRYYSDFDADNQKTRSELKADVRRIASTSRKLESMLINAPEALIQMISVGLDDRKSSSGVSTSISIISTSVSVLAALCSGILDIRLKREAKTRVLNACRVLWNLREELTAKQFNRSWDDADVSNESKRDGMVRRLTSADARFVQVIVHAIDPEVTMGRVRTELKKIARSNPRQKRARN